LAFGSKELDTLYHYNIKKNELVPKYVASFANDKHGYWSYELRKHFYTVLFGDKYKGKKVIVDKKTLKSDFFNIKNDFYGGIPVNKFYMSNNGMFISGIPPFALMEELDKSLRVGDLSGEMRNKITTLKNSLDENGNEVLFIGEMR
jgi:hypothetical protein